MFLGIWIHLKGYSYIGILFLKYERLYILSNVYLQLLLYLFFSYIIFMQLILEKNGYPNQLRHCKYSSPIVNLRWQPLEKIDFGAAWSNQDTRQRREKGVPPPGKRLCFLIFVLPWAVCAAEPTCGFCLFGISVLPLLFSRTIAFFRLTLIRQVSW